MTPNNYTEKDIHPLLIQDEINTIMGQVEEIQRTKGAGFFNLRGEFTGLQQKKLNGID